MVNIDSKNNIDGKKKNWFISDLKYKKRGLPYPTEADFD